MAVRVALATGLAWWLGHWVGVSRPVFAGLAVLVSVQPDVQGASRAAAQRLLGVAIGVGLGLAAEHLPGPSTVTVSLVLAVAFLVGDLVAAGPGVNTQVGVSALLVLASRQPGYGLDRLWETALGGAATVFVVAALAVATSHRQGRRLNRR